MSRSLGQASKEARRALDCGRALYRENLVPECHAHFANALAILLAAWAADRGEDPSSNTELADQDASALAELERAGYPSVGRLRAVVHRGGIAVRDQATAETRQPEIDLVWGEIERLYRFSVRRSDPPLRRARIRLLAGVAAGVLFLLLAVGAWRLWGRTFATASAVYSSHHAAANAIDGLEATEWLLPDGVLGWLQVNFPSPRALHHIRLLNAHNIYFQDRGCEHVRVTLYCEYQVVASAEGSFTGIVAGRSPLDFDLGADCVTHLRIDVLSYFKMGGGLAEVEVH